jgi:hypothetical protein
MASYIFVWEQNMYLQKRISKHAWPGHASMNIGNHFDSKVYSPPTDRTIDQMAAYKDYLDSLSHNYVSYWPNTAGATFGAADVFAKRSRAKNLRSVAEDIKMEQCLPDWVIKLDSDKAEEALMQSEWNTIREKAKKTYGAFKKNCSTVVSRVLHAGGFYARKWAVDCNWVWTPGDVRRLALKVGGLEMTWAQFEPVLTAAGFPPSSYGFKDYARDAAYNRIGTPSKYNWGVKVPGVGGNPIPG